jgi:hypothetical protein
VNPDARDVLRWALLLAMILVTLVLVACDNTSREVPNPVVVKDAKTLKCPPADGYDWKPWVKPPPTSLVMWVQTTSEEEFVAMCGAPMAGGTKLRYPATEACMRSYQEINIVYARGPREVYSEAFEEHESCHWWGYHGAPPMRPAYR